MASVPGSKVVVVAYDETTYKNTAVSPDGLRLSFAQFGVVPDQGRDNSEVLSGFRGRNRSVLGNRSVAGPVQHEVGPESIGFWLKHLIGAPDTTGSGPYEHVFEVGEGASALPPGITFEQDFTNRIGTPGRYMRYSGCRINRAGFTFNPGGFIAVNFDVIGADWDNSAVAPLDATPTDVGHSSFSAVNVTIALSDGGGPINICLKNLVLNWENDLDPDQFCISQGGVRDAMDEGFVTISGQITALFDHASVLNKILSDTDATMVITISRGTGDGTAGNEKLVIEIPALVFSASAPAINGPRGLEVQADFTAHRTSGEIGAKATLDNAQATI